MLLANFYKVLTMIGKSKNNSKQTVKVSEANQKLLISKALIVRPKFTIRKLQIILGKTEIHLCVRS